MHISSQPVLSTRVNVVIQDCQVHSVQKAKVSLALWSVFEHLLLLFPRFMFKFCNSVCVIIIDPWFLGSSWSAGLAR